jgi:hypothetical protein
MRLSQRAVKWFDPFLAAVSLIAAEVELLGRAQNGPLLVESRSLQDSRRRSPGDVERRARPHAW